jgi:hypothetical protein
LRLARFAFSPLAYPGAATTFAAGHNAISDNCLQREKVEEGQGP